MKTLRYISCFSGIGGLEASAPPLTYCEKEPSAAAVLKAIHPHVEVVPDIEELRSPPKADLVAGGWPCQDLSIAGRQAGLSGLRSRLLLDMLRVAKAAGAEAVVAENVPNLLRMRGGEEFHASLQAFRDWGFPFVAWRVLNAREFGLPQNRSRLLLVASKTEELTWPLFHTLPALGVDAIDPEIRGLAAGFYWTAGTHSINFSQGYVPAIKVGSGLGIASAPAVLYRVGPAHVVRTVTPAEALALQGFPKSVADLFESAGDAYRAAGNAVARPMGRWLLDGMVEPCLRPEFEAPTSSLWEAGPPIEGFPAAALVDDIGIRYPRLTRAARATNLYAFLDQTCEERLSGRAARGLISRLERSGHACPSELLSALRVIAETDLASRS